MRPRRLPAFQSPSQATSIPALPIRRFARLKSDWLRWNRPRGVLRRRLECLPYCCWDSRCCATAITWCARPRCSDPRYLCLPRYCPALGSQSILCPFPIPRLGKTRSLKRPVFCFWRRHQTRFAKSEISARWRSWLTTPIAFWWSTMCIAHPRCNGPWRWVQTWSFTPRPSTWTGKAAVSVVRS